PVPGLLSSTGDFGSFLSLRILPELIRFCAQANFSPCKSAPAARGVATHCEIVLATDENTLFAFPPIKRIVPITITRITASITAYSAISCPSSFRHNCLARSFIMLPPICVAKAQCLPLEPHVTGTGPGLQENGPTSALH